MYKLVLPKLVDQLVKVPSKVMTDDMITLELLILKGRQLPKWARNGLTRGLYAAFDELNRVKVCNETVIAALLQHLAELHADQEIRRGQKRVRSDGTNLRRMIRNRASQTMEVPDTCLVRPFKPITKH